MNNPNLLGIHVKLLEGSFKSSHEVSMRETLHNSIHSDFLYHSYKDSINFSESTAIVSLIIRSQTLSFRERGYYD